MDAKDWVILILPIVTNGVMIWVFQKKIEQIYKKKEYVDARKREVVDNFCRMLMDALDVVSEVEKQFSNRNEMTQINQKFCEVVSNLCRYGKNREAILNCVDQLEEIRAKSGFCHSRLVRYPSEKKRNGGEYLIEEDLKIMDDLSKIKVLMSGLLKKVINL